MEYCPVTARWLFSRASQDFLAARVCGRCQGLQDMVVVLRTLATVAIFIAIIARLMAIAPPGSPSVEDVVR